MSYDPNIPQPNDFLSDSQGDIKTNFTALNTIFAKNHFQFADGTSNNGRHSTIEMVNQSTPTGGGGISNLWSNSDGTTSQMYFMNEASNNAYQLTRAIDAKYINFATNIFASGNAAGAGWTFLPGGLLLQYGNTGPLATQANTTITFPVSYTVACFSVIATMNRSSTGDVAVGVNTLTKPSFKILNTSSTAGRTAYWIAIGK